MCRHQPKRDWATLLRNWATLWMKKVLGNPLCLSLVSGNPVSFKTSSETGMRNCALSEGCWQPQRCSPELRRLSPTASSFDMRPVFVSNVSPQNALSTNLQSMNPKQMQVKKTLAKHDRQRINCWNHPPWPRWQIAIVVTDSDARCSRHRASAARSKGHPA